MTMSQANLVAELKATLGLSTAKFTGGDTDFERHLEFAAMDIGRKRPRTFVGTVTLVADQAEYAPPADLIAPTHAIWGAKEQRRRKLWDDNYPKTLPGLTVVETATGRVLFLDPAPTGAQIIDLGSEYKFFYLAAHVIGVLAADTSVLLSDRNALIVRAAAEAMSELANSQVTSPVQLHNGLLGVAREMTPAGWYKMLMERFEGMVH